MSGIVGIFHVDGASVNVDVLRQMVDLLAHRGPDGSGVWHGASVGLGHRMLWTTPESLGEHLPLSTDNRRCVLTSDARIDNRDELIIALGKAESARHVPDSQLILWAYERWGEQCVQHLLGDFSFALWDGEKNSLFCARDHLGVKPFYYFRSRELFVFASEIKALFCIREVPRELNETWLGSHLVANYDDCEATSYAGIMRLPPAHSLTVDGSSVQLRSYWSLDLGREIRFDTNQEYDRAFRDVFAEAVRCRLRSAFPLGAELSGGVDSSSIVCVARDLLQQNETKRSLHTFSIIHQDVAESDERFFISAVVDQGGVTPHYVDPDNQSALADMDRWLWDADDVSCLPPTASAGRQLYRTARAAGVRVLLSGTYGDGVISYGDRAIYDYLRTGRWRLILGDLRHADAYYYGSKREMLWMEAVLPFVPRRFRASRRRVLRLIERRIQDLQCIRLDFARRTGLIERLYKEHVLKARLRTSREDHAYYVTWGAVPHALEILSNNAAAFDLEIRAPWLDKRVVEFCVALPAQQKRRDGYIKAIVRSALAASLPPEVKSRTTKAIADPYIRHCLLKHDKKRIMDLLSRDELLIDQYLDVQAIRSTFAEGKLDHVIPVWNAAILALWLHQIGLA